MANRTNIADRLKSGDVLLMDGGTGSEHIMAMRPVVKDGS